MQLKKRNWAGPEKCKLCEEVESTDHILSKCSIAIYIWVFVREMLSWATVPASFEELAEILGKYTNNGKICTKKLFIAAGMIWTLCSAENRVVLSAT